MTQSLSGAAATHVGLVRHHNEDSGYAGPGLLLVADGVGGHACGEVASATAAYVVTAAALGAPRRDPVAALRASLAHAQEQVARGAREPGREGMATTLTAVLGDGERFALLQLGDSRAYLLRDGALQRLGRDHTVVQDLLQDGTLTPEEAARHPWRHVVTRVLGGDVDERGDVELLDLHPGDRLLLCSDGLTDLVDETAIETTVRGHDDVGAVDALVDAALTAGGRDNVTCIVATVVPGLPRSWDGRFVGAGQDPRLVVDPASVRLPRSA